MTRPGIEPRSPGLEWWNMPIYTNIYIYAHIHVHIYLYIYMSIYMYMYGYVYVYIYICIYIFVYMCIFHHSNPTTKKCCRTITLASGHRYKKADKTDIYIILNKSYGHSKLQIILNNKNKFKKLNYNPTN